MEKENQRKAQDDGSIHKAKHIGDLQTLEKARRWILPQGLKKGTLISESGFSPGTLPEFQFQ